VHPRVDRRLRCGQVGEGPAVIEQLAAQGLVPALDLAGGRGRARLGQPGGDAVLPADPLEQHFGGSGLGEPAGELLPVVGQHLRRDPVIGHRRGERVADRAPVGHRHHRGDHHIAGVIIDAGDHLALAAVGQIDPADQVHLPQVHRRLALPALVLTTVALLLGLDQAVADQRPMHRRARRHPIHPAGRELEHDPACAPAGMGPAQLAHQRLYLGRHPARAGVRAS